MFSARSENQLGKAVGQRTKPRRHKDEDVLHGLPQAFELRDDLGLHLIMLGKDVLGRESQDFLDHGIRAVGLESV